MRVLDIEEQVRLIEHLSAVAKIFQTYGEELREHPLLAYECQKWMKEVHEDLIDMELVG